MSTQSVKDLCFYSFKAENLLARIEVGYKVNAFFKKENKLEYYAETWGYFLDLRKKSAGGYLSEMPYPIYTILQTRLSGNISNIN